MQLIETVYTSCNIKKARLVEIMHAEEAITVAGKMITAERRVGFPGRI